MSLISQKTRAHRANYTGIFYVSILLFLTWTRPCAADTDSVHWKILTFLNENSLYTIDQYAKWLDKNIAYRSDGIGDHWADPLETIKKRSGDCEDFAFLSAEVVRTFGYQPLVLAVGSGENAHVICVFKRQSVYYAFDNNELNRTNQTTLEAIAKFFAHTMKAEFILELSLHPNKVHPLYVIKKTGEIIHFSGNEWFKHK